MELRERVNVAVKQAMREKDAARLSTLRLINAAIKDRDIAARADGQENGVDDSEVLAILGKMVKQRRESAEREMAEIEVIEEFLPRALSDAEVSAAVDAAVAEVGAESIRDMGRVMGVLKSKYTGQMDFAAAGPLVKARLAS